MIRLTVITPTIARASLAETLSSIAPQLQPGDEHLVIGDGPQPWARVVSDSHGAIYHDGPRTRSFGTAQRDYGAQVATGDYLLYCDDDDLYMPDALSVVRRAIEREPGIPLVFRMDTPWAGLLWKAPVLECGNVGTPMIVAPRDSRLPLWVDDENPYTADSRFAKRLVANHAGRVGWQEETICFVRRI